MSLLREALAKPLRRKCEVCDGSGCDAACDEGRCAECDGVGIVVYDWEEQ
jgi:DnaJ-class molecular chaperone